MFCIVCNKWCHQCCSELRNIIGLQNIVCPRCERDDGEGTNGREEVDIGIEVKDVVMEELEQYCT